MRHPNLIRRFCACSIVALLGQSAALASSEPSPAATRGISDDPCRGVPVLPTAAHKASGDEWQAWMYDWLALDWGQLCKYRDENAALPAPGPRRIVMFGDSITEFWKSASPGFFTADVIDRGISGQTTSQMLLRFRSDVIALRPAVVHLMAGGNDIAGNTGATSYDVVLGNLASMVELARANGIRVVLAALTPAQAFYWNPSMRPSPTIQEMNRRLRTYAEREHVTFVDYGPVLSDGHGGIRKEYAEDGVHPTAAGYAVMAPIARAAIERALTRPSDDLSQGEK